MFFNHETSDHTLTQNFRKLGFKNLNFDGSSNCGKNRYLEKKFIRVLKKKNTFMFDREYLRYNLKRWYGQ